MEQEQQHPLDMCVLEAAASLVAEQMLPGALSSPAGAAAVAAAVAGVRIEDTADCPLLLLSNNNNTINRYPEDESSLSAAAAEARKRRKQIIISHRRSSEIMEQATKDVASAVLDDLSLDASLATAAVLNHKRKHDAMTQAAVESALSQELESPGVETDNNNHHNGAPQDSPVQKNTTTDKPESSTTTTMHHGDGSIGNSISTPAVASAVDLAASSSPGDIPPTAALPLNPPLVHAVAGTTTAANATTADEEMDSGNISSSSNSNSKMMAAAAAAATSSSLLSNCKKAQIRYEPAVAMDKDQLTAWRREARRVRNRESAAASRMKTKERIQELEEQVGCWKQKYLAAMDRMQELQQRGGGGQPDTRAPALPHPPSQNHNDDDDNDNATEDDANNASALGTGGS
jgi:hypothetical protein